MREFEHGGPREKLLCHGTESLCDVELLAIFLRTGYQGKNVLTLSQEVLSSFEGLNGLLSANLAEFSRIKGLGKAKYVQLQACLEMSKRFFCEEIKRGDSLSNPKAVTQFLQSQMIDSPNEVFAALFLDNQNRVIAFEKLFNGTINAASVHPRVIAQRALVLNAAALIVAHNHPSGVSEPSISDLEVTHKIKQTLELIDVRLLDHIIVVNGRCTSLAERGEI